MNAIKSKKTAFFVILFCLVFIAYLSTISNRDLDQITTDVPAFSGIKTTDVSSPTLEEKLVGTEEIEGYTVETYQEFEIYKDKDGNIKKVVPTSNFNYLKYKSDE
ncbi:hypothetical protein [Heyndrickxia camelliae]|uniref:Uncharacterized protein n=1 Tax=Heyndrickxia camelliae TaxID=1707093 RepID=A0A2N3LQI6_9BACI|nr:hypothetical protein [Heyndrickxia camelliae]PKR86829.1 hypothetical protein CWO92_01885 [Heyndrickxia camelliae]